MEYILGIIILLFMFMVFINPIISRVNRIHINNKIQSEQINSMNKRLTNLSYQNELLKHQNELLRKGKNKD